MKKLSLFFVAILFAAGCVESPGADSAESQESASQPWTEVHHAAWDIVSSSRYVTLITLDEGGHPQARILDAIPPDSGRFEIWMGTNRNSAKVQEILDDPRATLYYQIPNGGGYVTLRGNAEIVDDPAAKERYWRDAWAPFYPDRDAMFVLIRFQPLDGEVVSFADGLMGETVTWAAPEFEF